MRQGLAINVYEKLNVRNLSIYLVLGLRRRFVQADGIQIVVQPIAGH